MPHRTVYEVPGSRAGRLAEFRAAEDFYRLCMDVLRACVELYPRDDCDLLRLRSDEVQDLYEVAAERGRLAQFERACARMEQQLTW